MMPTIPRPSPFGLPRPPAGAVRLIVSLLAGSLLATAQAQDIDTWVRDLQQGDATQRREAAFQLHQLGPEAAPALPALIKALEDREQQVWFHSIMTLAEIGPAAPDAVPELINDLNQGGGRRRRGYTGQVWYRTAYALGKIGEPALPALIEALGHESESVRSGAAKALTWLGPKAEPAMPKLLGQLNDSRNLPRQYAAEALGMIGPKAVPPLLEALGAPEAPVRQAAAEALAWMGPSARAEAGPTLLATLDKESSPDVRAECIRSLSKLQSADEAFVSLLLRALGSDEETEKHEAVSALLLLEPPESKTVPRLIERLQSKNAEVRRQAAYVLGRLGPSAQEAVAPLVAVVLEEPDPQPGEDPFLAALIQIGTPAVPALLASLEKVDVAALGKEHWIITTLKEMGEPALPALMASLDSPTISVRVGATQAIRQMGLLARRAEGPLMDHLDDPEAPVRAGAILGLISIGAPLANLAPRFEEALKDDAPEVRRAAAVAFAEIGNKGEDHAPALVAVLDDEDLKVQEEALRALGAIGPDAKSAVPKLVAKLDHSDVAIRVEATRALGRIGPDAAAAVPALIRECAEGEEALRLSALESLGRIGPAAASALPQVQSQLTHETPAIRAAAVTALGLIQADASESLPHLVRGLEDPDADVRHAAAEAVGRLGQAGRPATRPLVALLKNKEDWSVALDALRQVEADSVPDLIQALDNSEPSVRLYACEALGKLGPRAKDALPQLRNLEKDDYDFIRRQARDAVRRIGEGT